MMWTSRSLDFAKGIPYLAMLCIMLLAACSKHTIYSKAPVSGEEVNIDVLSLKPDVPQFFTYDSGNENINFFVIKIDNEVLSFLDKCVSCKSKVGFTFSSGHFTCKECGTAYSVMEGRWEMRLKIKKDNAEDNVTFAFPVSSG